MVKIIFLVLLLLMACKNKDASETQNVNLCLDRFGLNSEWSNETEVIINGYTLNAMEPKVSQDQNTLFWNDKPASDEMMNIHYAVKDTFGVYQYVGTLTGTVNGSSLDGVPAIDNIGNFYFVSLRDYVATFRTVFGGSVDVPAANTLQILNVNSADSLASQATSGTVDMDIDISGDGQEMVVSRATFTGDPYPETSRLLIFDVNARQMALRSDSETATEAVNISYCRLYAGSFSHDRLELYFTVIPLGAISSGDNFRIGVATRASLNDPFTNPKLISGLSGRYIEGPALSQNDSTKTMFFHRFESQSGRFKIYKVTRP